MLSKCMGILKFTFFRVHQTKSNLVSRQRMALNLMSLACKGYTSTSEIEAFESNVKQKALNDEKR